MQAAGRVLSIVVLCLATTLAFAAQWSQPTKDLLAAARSGDTKAAKRAIKAEAESRLNGDGWFSWR